MLRASTSNFFKIIGAAIFLPIYLAATSGAAMAQAYPDKNITLIIPYAAGGSTDATGRIVADRMSKSLGQTIVIENRAGAAGVIGTRELVRAKPDGYTLGVGTTGSLILSHLLGSAPGYQRDDVVIIGNASKVDLVFVARPDFPYSTIQEINDAAKDNLIIYASAGIGTPVHLAFELWQEASEVEFRHVPYKGDSDALTAIMGGQVDIGLISLSGALESIKAGTVKAIALAGASRAPSLPEMPTMAESGVAGYEASTVTPIIAPKGTPQEIVDRLNAALNDALTDPWVKERYAQLGLSGSPMTQREAIAMVDAMREMWGDIIKNADLTAK